MLPRDDRHEPVRGVLLDAGGTLLAVRDSVGAVYAAVARRHGAAPDPVQLETRFHREFARRRGGFLEGVGRPHSPAREVAWWRALVAAVFQGVPGLAPSEPGFAPFFAELYREFEKPDHWQRFPDVLPLLDSLAARGVPAAVVSNWDSRLHPVLEALGVARRVRFVLTSAEFGAEKPDPAIFREAVARLGLAPGQVLHVGDSRADDVEGARSAGLQALWLRRAGGEAPCGGEGWVRSLDAVAERLHPGV